MNALTRSITVVLVLVLLVAATLRTTGLDYPVYLAEFLDPVDSLSSKEVGYVALITLVGHVAGFWLVLLVSNATFLACHLTALARTRTVAQSTAFMMYLVYVGLFLIYGSPRRLIAFSLVACTILAITFRPQSTKNRVPRYAALVAIACAFHASALVFVPFLIAYAYGRSLFSSGRKLIGLMILAAIGTALLYYAGVFDYLAMKLVYYAVDAASEQAYLEEVPSVTSGLLKRFVALSLLWLGTRHAPQIRRPSLDFCVIEATLYGALGAVSPVLAVTASYFAIGYLLPILSVRLRPGKVTLSSLALLGGAAAYYLPTSIGLVRLFGNFYVS